MVFLLRSSPRGTGGMSWTALMLSRRLQRVLVPCGWVVLLIVALVWIGGWTQQMPDDYAGADSDEMVAHVAGRTIVMRVDGNDVDDGTRASFAGRSPDELDAISTLPSMPVSSPPLGLTSVFTTSRRQRRKSAAPVPDVDPRGYIAYLPHSGLNNQRCALLGAMLFLLA